MKMGGLDVKECHTNEEVGTLSSHVEPRKAGALLAVFSKL